MDKYIQTLQKTPAVNTRTHHAKTDLVTNATIEKIIKLLRCAFKQAVRWELIAKNPFDNVVLPKTEYKKRDIWTADMIRTALDQCTDSKLYVAMNLSFACSLRMGEILGLTWNNVHISDDDIADDNAYVSSTRSWRGPPSGPLRCWGRRMSTTSLRRCFPTPAPG